MISRRSPFRDRRAAAGHVVTRRAFVGGAVAIAALLAGKVNAQTRGFGIPRVSLPDIPADGVAGGPGAAWVQLLTSSPLLNMAPDGRISGDLAMSWVMNAGRDQFELRIRPDALFADGTRIMADDVVASADLARAAHAGTPDAWRWEHIASIEAAPDNVVRLSLTVPDASIPALFASHLVPVVPATWIAQGNAPGREPYAPASGCYQRLPAPNDILQFTRNNAFFQVGRPRLAGVLCTTPSETMLRTTDLVTGGVDLLIDAPLLDVPMLREDPGITLVGGPTTRLCQLTANLSSPTLRDVRLRRLVSGAIDRGALVQAATSAEAVPASTLIPVDHWAGLDYTSDLIGAEEVRAGLTSLGLPPGIELRLLASDIDASLANACVLLQEQLAWAGIALSLDLLDEAEMREAMADGRWDLVMRYTPYWRDPHELVRPLLVSDGTQNVGGYVNDRVDYLAALASQASDNAYRTGFYQTIQRIVVNDVPVIPLFFPNYYDAMSVRLQDYPYVPPISANAMRQVTMTRPDPVTLP